ncbi:MAG TPA: phosphate/phosphite/phosphonate ABC transporter substrate-binding protein [Beijerinckiaceae bacterium]|nr:phosphate/phosphite/phosphonate ABC transporter substrate-binding protein [Beijerinckiaceae bacterium]
MVRALMMAAAVFAAAPALAQDSCPNRGQLDNAYCDANNDLVADTPTDPARLKDPSTLIFAYSPVENPAVYQTVYQPFMDHLGSCTGKKIVYYPVQNNAAQIEAMRSGRLHISGFATGVVGFAVNLAGAVPFAVIGSEKGVSGYKLFALVKSDSPYKSLPELKGRKVAHTSPSSNSGNLAPRVFFPDLGLKPDDDYKVLMSGGHDKSVMGVASGDYDMAPVASDVYERMVARGAVKPDTLRLIWQSETFPTSSWSIPHDLKPELARKISQCFMDYKWHEGLKKEYSGEDRFLPMTYKETWKPIRDVAEKSGTPYNRAAYDAQVKREAEAAAKKAAEAAAKAAGQPQAPKP